MESLEEVIKENRSRFKKMMIVADGVFSMTGDIAKLPEMVEIAKKYNVLVYVDDAHGLGVMGDSGRGTINHFNLSNHVPFNMGTFSKSFASIGGFVSGPSEAIEYIKHSARSFIFSASMPPAAVATAMACVDILSNDDSVVRKLWDNVDFINKGFKELGFYTYGSSTPIIPIFIGDEIKAMKLTSFLDDMGIFATPVVSPAVPEKDALIRTSYMACHSKDELQKVLEVFAVAKKKFNIPTTYQ
jgi:7-keto-8-aminopelargonate synthetase-like enzyme